LHLALCMLLASSCMLHAARCMLPASCCIRDWSRDLLRCLARRACAAAGLTDRPAVHCRRRSLARPLCGAARGGAPPPGGRAPGAACHDGAAEPRRALRSSKPPLTHTPTHTHPALPARTPCELRGPFAFARRTRSSAKRRGTLFNRAL
jgi:hypothetical protein